MGRLVCTAIGSLDGFIADTAGGFGWAMPDAEVHAFVNDTVRGVGTYLYGRRTYTLMTGWEHDEELARSSPETGDFAALWQRADKIVYSSSLPDVSTRRTTLRRLFDADEVRRLKAASDADLAISGPTLARHAFAAGLVDEVQVFLVPVLVGAGLWLWPGSGATLALREEHRFANGVVWLRHDVVGPGPGPVT